MKNTIIYISILALHLLFKNNAYRQLKAIIQNNMHMCLLCVCVWFTHEVLNGR